MCIPSSYKVSKSKIIYVIISHTIVTHLSHTHIHSPCTQYWTLQYMCCRSEDTRRPKVRYTYGSSRKTCPQHMHFTCEKLEWKRQKTSCTWEMPALISKEVHMYTCTVCISSRVVETVSLTDRQTVSLTDRQTVSLSQILTGRSVDSPILARVIWWDTVSHCIIDAVFKTDWWGKGEHNVLTMHYKITFYRRQGD